MMVPSARRELGGAAGQKSGFNNFGEGGQRRSCSLPSRARERRAPIPASCETELRRADRPARAGCAAADRRRRFLFSDFRFGRRWSSGGATDADVGFVGGGDGAGERREVPGRSTAIGKFSSTDMVRLAS